jgi:hypothetical protein
VASLNFSWSEINTDKWMLVAQEVLRLLEQQRGRDAEIARDRQRYSLERNPSERDLGWKHCAKVVAEAIESAPLEVELLDEKRE